MFKKTNQQKEYEGLDQMGIISSIPFVRGVLILSFIFLFSLSFISAANSDCSIYGNCKPTTSGTTNINNSYTNINNTYTTINGTSYNVSYDAGIKWFYNMTLPFATWLSTFNYNYNQTYSGGTYNVTYDALNSTYGWSWINWTNQLPKWVKEANFTNGTVIQTCQNYLSALNWSFFKSGVYNNLNEATFFNKTNISNQGIYLSGTNLTGDFNSMVFTNGTSSYWNITLGISTRNLTSNITGDVNKNITLQTRTANSYNISDVGLVAFWGLNNNTGENATYFKDETGRFNGTCSNCPTLTPNGTVGNAMLFDGSDDYINLGNLTQSGNVSFSSWVYFKVLSGYVSLLGNYDGHSHGIFWGTGGASGNNLYVQLPNIGSYTARTGTEILVLNKWYYLASTKNDTEIVVYINGIKDTIASSGDTMTPSMDAQDANMYLGSNPLGQRSTGIMDEVRIYNRSLSASEIQNLYQLGSYHISDWSNYSTPNTVNDNIGQVTSSQGKFMQFKTNFATNNTQVSPYLLNYSVSKSYGGVNTTTCQNTTYNSTLNFGDTVLFAKDYRVNSMIYTGDAYSEAKDIGATVTANKFADIDYKDKNIKGNIGFSWLLKLVIQEREEIEASKIRVTNLETEINRIKDCAKEIDYKTYQICIGKI